MLSITDKIKLIKSILANPQIFKVNPRINLFLLNYLRKFNLKKVSDKFIIHSHLPPVNSSAYSRFITEHLLAKTIGPSHAQIGITNNCHQNCDYCYSKSRSGKVISTKTINQTIKQLKEMGVFWLGFTGGEPLLNEDIVEIVESTGDNCVAKLFTSGYNLTKDLAVKLKEAGLFYVSISLDHWQEERHDQMRGWKGAFKTALEAIEIFKEVGGIHLSVSTVLSKEMLSKNKMEKFLKFLDQLGIHEAWLSEVKPSVRAFWDEEFIITKKEKENLINLQDRYNKQEGMTVNYLGHFEGKAHFGCAAGHKMVYIDAFGEVSPCVFTPMTFGNVAKKSVKIIFKEMKDYFPSSNSCFINDNFKLFKEYYKGQLPLDKKTTLQLIEEVEFGPLADFFKLYYGRREG